MAIYTNIDGTLKELGKGNNKIITGHYTGDNTGYVDVTVANTSSKWILTYIGLSPREIIFPFNPITVLLIDTNNNDTMTVITQNTVKGGYPQAIYYVGSGILTQLTSTSINALKLNNNKLQIIHALRDVSSSPIGEFSDDTKFTSIDGSGTDYEDLYNITNHKYTYIAWC